MIKQNKWLVASISAVLLSSLTLWEGNKTDAYIDMAGVLTACSGYTGKDIIRTRSYTEAECATINKKTLVTYGTAILNCITVPINQNQYDAYVLFSVNVGVQGFCSSRSVFLLNSGKYAESCNALAYSPSGKPVWSYIHRVQFVPGLFNRRLYERLLCLGNYNAKY